ncbi:MAG: HAD-IA family hydrolase [Candidatus Magasanikbacteria bacterium]
MQKILISDLSRTVLFPTDEDYDGSLNDLHEELSQQDDYQVWDHFRLNEDLLEFYKKINDKTDVYIFTTRFIQEYPPIAKKLEPIFENIFSVKSDDLPAKSDPKAYKKLADKLDIDVEQIVFVDDNTSNTQAAKEAGVKTVEFNSTEQAIGDINETIMMSKMPKKAKEMGVEDLGDLEDLIDE